MQPEEKTLFILCGEAFAGKSTLAQKISEQYGAKVIGRDAIYFSVEGLLALETTPEAEDHALWENLWPIALQGVRNQLSLGNSVVVDDNCFYLRQRDQLRVIAEECGAKAILIYLAIPPEELRRRKEENKRTQERHDVPSEWIAEDAELFERPSEKERPIVYTSKLSLEELLSNRF